MSRIPLVPSPPGWVAAALADLPAVLLDHAHCEKKAAHTAVRHIAKYAAWPRFAPRMSRLAREELVHFERVLAEMAARGIAFRPQASAGYAAALMAWGGPAGLCPAGGRRGLAAARTVDEMITCALIEARSHERFQLLAVAVDDAGLRAFYQELGEAEARHGELYLELAAEAGGDVDGRLAALAQHEARVLVRPGQPVRMHAGGVS